MDLAALAPLHLPGSAPEPLALLHLPDRRACPHHRGRRVRADHGRRRVRPVHLPVPADLGRPRSAGLRPPPGRGRHQRTASLHGPARLAWRALARVRLLAGGHAPRPWVGERHPAVPRARGLPRVRGGGRRRPGLASGERPEPVGRMAGRRRRGRGLHAGRHAVFALEGPLRPGWSHRAGTSSAVLSQLAQATVAPSPSATTVPSKTAAEGAASRRRRSHRRCRGPSVQVVVRLPERSRHPPGAPRRRRPLSMCSWSGRPSAAGCEWRRAPSRSARTKGP